MGDNPPAMKAKVFMEHRFKAITNRSEGRFDFSEAELREELLQVASSSDFRETTRETAREIIDDTSGAIWFSGYDLTDPAFHK
ncbi:MAG: hypothetical protein GX915_08350 [Clostridiales bacterium]|nr:hypothetical protein [Clostridiales bacterium]